MLNQRNLGLSVALLLIAFWLSFTARAQEDCVYGFRIYVHDEAGKTIESAKLEVTGLSGKDKLPESVKPYAEKPGVYNVHGSGGTAIKGNFVLKVAAQGYEPDERQLNFPKCEMQSFELVLRPAGSLDKAIFERLLSVHGKVFDEEMKPFGSAKIEARSANGRVYQTSSNAYGYYELNLPQGVMTIRVTGSMVPAVLFENFKIEKNYSVLNVPVCRKCRQNETKN